MIVHELMTYDLVSFSRSQWALNFLEGIEEFCQYFSSFLYKKTYM